MTNPQTPPRRDGWVELGIAVSAVSAAVSSFSGLRLLATVAGWVPAMAWLFPLTVDAYAMTATRVWVAGSTRSVRARRFARANAVGAILMSLAGNATYHLIAAGLIAVTWPIVLGVGAVPPLVLGLVSHLAVLRTQVDTPSPDLIPVPMVSGSYPEQVPAAVPVTMGTPAVPANVSPQAVPAAASVGPSPAAVVPRPAKAVRRRSPSPALESGDGTRTHASDDDLLAEARAADARWREANGARPITRDALRQALSVGGPKATALLRRLKDETATPATPGP